MALAWRTTAVRQKGSVTLRLVGRSVRSPPAANATKGKSFFSFSSLSRVSEDVLPGSFTTSPWSNGFLPHMRQWNGSLAECRVSGTAAEDQFWSSFFALLLFCCCVSYSECVLWLAAKTEKHTQNHPCLSLLWTLCARVWVSLMSLRGAKRLRKKLRKDIGEGGKSTKSNLCKCVPLQN